MSADDSLAQFAANFLQVYSQEDDAAPSPTVPEAEAYPLVTPLARQLLQSVDAGGVPAFVTEQLRQIAMENGIAVSDATTPNQIVDALRSKALGG